MSEEIKTRASIAGLVIVFLLPDIGNFVKQITRSGWRNPGAIKGSHHTRCDPLIFQSWNLSSIRSNIKSPLPMLQVFPRHGRFQRCRIVARSE